MADRDGGGSQLCASGRFLASNGSAGHPGVVVSRGDATIERADVRRADLGRRPDYGPARAGVTTTGVVTTLDPTDGSLVRRAPSDELTGAYLASSEADGVVDLLVGDPAGPPGLARIVSVPSGR